MRPSLIASAPNPKRKRNQFALKRPGEDPGFAPVCIWEPKQGHQEWASLHILAYYPLLVSSSIILSTGQGSFFLL